MFLSLLCDLTRGLFVLPAFPMNGRSGRRKLSLRPRFVFRNGEEDCRLHRRVLVGEDVSEEVWNRMEAQPDDR
jgi:hypothetical protein